MKKKYFFLAVLIVLIGLFFRSYAFNTTYFLGTDDTYHHKMVIDYYKENGFSKNIYENDSCMFREISQPYGFYFLPTILPFDSETSMKISLAIFFVATMFLFYRYCSKVDKKFAIIALALLSFSFSNVTKSNIWYYRGENLLMPFLIASLAVNNRFLKGLLLGVTVFIWQGYSFALVCYNLSIFLPIIYSYLKNKEFKKYFKDLAVGNLFFLAFLILKIIFGLSNLMDYQFFIVSSIIIASVIIIGLIFSIKSKNKFFKPALVVSLIFIALSVIFLGNMKFEFFELINPNGEFFSSINELGKFSFDSRFFLTFNILLFFPLGIIFFIKKDAKKFLFFLGLALPCLFFVFQALRFYYFGSYAMVLFLAYFLTRLKSKKYYSILLSVFIIASLIFTIIDIKTVYPLININEINAANFLLNNNYSSMCIETMWDKASIYQYFGLKTSTDSVAGQFRSEKIIPFYRFLLNNDTYPLNNNSLLIVEHSFWNYLPNMALLINDSKNYYVDYFSYHENNTYFGINQYYLNLDHLEAYVIINSSKFVPKRIYFHNKNETRLINIEKSFYPIIDGCMILFSPNLGVYVSKDACDSPFAKLMLNYYNPKMDLVFYDNWIKVYKYNE